MSPKTALCVVKVKRTSYAKAKMKQAKASKNVVLEHVLHSNNIRITRFASDDDIREYNSWEPRLTSKVYDYGKR